jgi:hypothetical protein
MNSLSEERPVEIYCKITGITMTTDREGCILFTKDKESTLKTTIRLLKGLEGKDVILILSPYSRGSKKNSIKSL